MAKRLGVCRMTIIRYENNNPEFPKSRVDPGGRRYFFLDEIEAWEALQESRHQAELLAAAGLTDDPEKAAMVLNGRLRGAAKRTVETAQA
jgi:predicted DNA-binding transcriptional regulator AlpA